MSQNKTWFFRSNVFLKDLSAAELAVVDARSSVQKIKRKSVLWTHGDPSKHAYWIRNGVVKIFRHAFGGRTHGLDYFTKGDLVGEECIFSESPRTNEAVAYEDVTALAVEKGVFIELGQRKSLVLERIGRSITEKKNLPRTMALVPVVPDGTRAIGRLILATGEEIWGSR